MQEFLSFCKEEIINDIRKIPRFLKAIIKFDLCFMLSIIAFHSFHTSKFDFILAIITILMILLK